MLKNPACIQLYSSHSVCVPRCSRLYYGEGQAHLLLSHCNCTQIQACLLSVSCRLLFSVKVGPDPDTNQGCPQNVVGSLVTALDIEQLGLEVMGVAGDLMDRLGLRCCPKTYLNVAKAEAGWVGLSSKHELPKLRPGRGLAFCSKSRYLWPAQHPLQSVSKVQWLGPDIGND